MAAQGTQGSGLTTDNIRHCRLWVHEAVPGALFSICEA